MVAVGSCLNKSDRWHPQKKAEVMVGQIAVAENKAKQPEKLKQLFLGESTAIEIQWITEAEQF